MCITFFYLATDSDQNGYPYKFIQVFNREEDFERPTAPLSFWEDDKNILAGRDTRGGGSWLGINVKTGNIAFLTNVDSKYVIHQNKNEHPLSRGKLIWDFLRSDFFDQKVIIEDKNEPADNLDIMIEKYITGIQEVKENYRGFNLILGNFKTMKFRYLSNEKQSKGIAGLETGSYGLTNCPMFYKCLTTTNGLALFDHTLSTLKENATENQILESLENVGGESFKFPYSNFEEVVFVDGRIEVLKKTIWATKSTSLILVDHQNRLKYVELSYDENLKVRGKIIKEVQLPF